MLDVSSFTWERGSVSRGIVLQSNSVTVELVFSVPWLRVDFKTVCPSTLWHDECIRAWDHSHKWACSKTFANICRLSENSAQNDFVLFSYCEIGLLYPWHLSGPFAHLWHIVDTHLHCQHFLSRSQCLHLPLPLLCKHGRVYVSCVCVYVCVWHLKEREEFLNCLGSLRKIGVGSKARMTDDDVRYVGLGDDTTSQNDTFLRLFIITTPKNWCW